MFPRVQITTLLAFAVLNFPINGKKQYGKIFYVLMWTTMEDQIWNYRNLDHENGHSAFIKRNCSFQNCYLTTNREYFESVLDFDVFLFNTVHLSQGYSKWPLPTQRSPNQLYILFSVEPSSYTPIDYAYNGIFNLTWTYKLKSDIVHPYFLIKNKFGEIIGPKIDAHWFDIKDIPPTDPTIVQKIERKSIAALWVSSNCYPKRRYIFVQSLKHELSKYGHQVDIYGGCGDQNHCQKNTGDKDGVLTSCYSKIESDYYFYLAFENSFGEDYISEKVLHGLLHFSVPIVFGGADYTRFLPDGIYLNAMKLGVEGTAQEMINIINNRQRYYDFFKWHHYYSIYDTAADDYSESVCSFCAFLNNRIEKNETQVYENIGAWWFSPYPEEFSRITYADSPSQFGGIENSGETTVPTTFSKIIDFILDFA